MSFIQNYCVLVCMCTAEHYHEKEYYLCIIIPIVISPCVKLL